MKKMMMTAGLVVAALALSSDSPAQPPLPERVTLIHFTRNLNPALFTSECIGVVSTETLPARRGNKIWWRVKNGNGHDSEDVCPGMDKSQVELRFETDVMGAAVMKVLKSNTGGNIRVKILMVASEATQAAHKYQVFYKGVAAGPDPEIEVEWCSCGPGGGGPGGGN